MRGMYVKKNHEVYRYHLKLKDENETVIASEATNCLYMFRLNSRGCLLYWWEYEVNSNTFGYTI
jgi:hypothetical protein